MGLIGELLPFSWAQVRNVYRLGDCQSFIFQPRKNTNCIMPTLKTRKLLAPFVFENCPINSMFSTKFGGIYLYTNINAWDEHITLFFLRTRHNNLCSCVAFSCCTRWWSDVVEGCLGLVVQDARRSHFQRGFSTAPLQAWKGKFWGSSWCGI